MTRVNIGDQVSVEIVSGPWKSDPKKTWEGIKFTIGDWSTIEFPKSKFEMDHIKSILEDIA